MGGVGSRDRAPAFGGHIRQSRPESGRGCLIRPAFSSHIRQSRPESGQNLALAVVYVPRWAARPLLKGRLKRLSSFFIDNLLVRIHFIIVMIWWTGLAPWELVGGMSPRHGRRGFPRPRARVPIGTVLNLRTTTSQNCAAVPRWARI